MTSPASSLPSVPTRSLAGRTAVVTGSTSGIGLGIARALAGAGASVVLNGFGSAADIERLCADLETETGVTVGYSGADMRKPDEIATMIAETESRIAPVDILVNNAGIQHVSPVESFPQEKWDDIIAINLSAVFHATRAVLGGMKERGWGRIINTGSAHALVASPFKSAYVAAKHGVMGLTKVVALEAANSRLSAQIARIGEQVSRQGEQLQRAEEAAPPPPLPPPVPVAPAPARPVSAAGGRFGEQTGHINEQITRSREQLSRIAEQLLRLEKAQAELREEVVQQGEDQQQLLEGLQNRVAEVPVQVQRRFEAVLGIDGEETEREEAAAKSETGAVQEEIRQLGKHMSELVAQLGKLAVPAAEPAKAEAKAKPKAEAKPAVRRFAAR